jgi:integrase
VTRGTQKITKRVVDAAVPQPKRFHIWDVEIKGFGLLVLPSGVKSYIFDYRTPQAIKRRITIGQHGAWTPEQARRKAEEYRQVVRAGADPLGDKQALRDAATISAVFDAYLLSEDFANKAAETQSHDRARIERHLRPLLGKKHPHLLTPQDVQRAQKAIAEGHTRTDVKTGKRGRAIVRGGRVAAQMAIVSFRAICNWAIREGLMADNPCRSLKLGTSATRDAILEDAADYARLFETLARMESERRIRPAVADAIRLISLVGCRRSEAANLRWSQVDLQRGRIVLPPSAHKTGKATAKPRIIGLPAAAQAVIARQPEGDPDDFVFRPGRSDGGASDLSHVWAKVRAEAKLPANIGLHSLRHSVASHLAMGGAQAAEIMAAMGHRQISTAARYIHFADNARNALAERAASVALAGMAASSSKWSADVVKLAKGHK